MAQAKRKTATRTKKAGQKCQSCRKAKTCTAKKQQVSQNERIHVYIVTAMAMVVGILLCANAAMMTV